MDCKSAIIVSERILKTLIKKLNATKSYETEKSVATSISCDIKDILNENKIDKGKIIIIKSKL